MTNTTMQEWTHIHQRILRKTIELSYGWDFAYNDNDPSDVLRHGTHVAGTIAGKGNNGVGVTGVAWNVKIMPLKFIDDINGGAISDAILAINYATVIFGIFSSDQSKMWEVDL